MNNTLNISDLFKAANTGVIDAEFTHENKSFHVTIGLCKIHSANLEQLKNDYLSNYEHQFAIKHRTGKQRDYYKAGRIAAKIAITRNTHENDPKKIEIHNGVHGEPIIINSNLKNNQVSISHCDGIAIAVVFPEKLQIALDIENTHRYRTQYIDNLLSKNEKKLLETLKLDKEMMFFALWTMHEAMGKTLKTGIAIDRDLFEVTEIRSVNNQCLKGTFKNFPNHEGISMFIENWCLSLVLPSQTEFRLV